MKSATPGHASFCKTATLSLLLGLCAQAAAAAVDVSCDHARELALDYPVAELSEFTVEMIDHGVTSAISGDESAGSPEKTDTPSASPAPVDSLLRQILDETLISDKTTKTPAGKASAAPLAELSLPGQRSPPADKQETDTTAVEGAEEFNTRLPGTSEEEVRRYREQMYRTDI